MKSIRLCALASAALLLGSMVVAQTGPARQAPPATPAAPPKAAVTDQQKNAAEEILLAEEIVSARDRYRKQLEKMVDLYARTNNEFKAKMAREELESLRKGKQFNYIVIAEVMAPTLKPLRNIPEAERLYTLARELDNLNDPFAPGENKRKALALYNELICRYPESNRISESAFHAAVIYENVVHDFYSAVIYYERAYQWDPMTSQPARIQAARVAYYRIADYRKAKSLYEAATENASAPAHRAEARAMVDLLKAMGY